jgi:hypothetical protein
LPDDLSEDAPSGLRETYHAIVQVLSLRYLFGKSPSPLVRGFLARWSGLTEWAVGHCLQWLLKHWYLKGGVFLCKDGTFSETRETKTSPECFVMRLSIPEQRGRGNSGTYVKRTRREWAVYRAEQRDLEAMFWTQFEEAETRGDLDDLVERDEELYNEDWSLQEPYATMIQELDAKGEEGWL